jgi:hypothetical protein
MRRYLIAAVIAEIVSVMCLWIFVGFLRLGAHQQLLTGMCFQILPCDPQGHGGRVAQLVSSDQYPLMRGSMEDRAFNLAGQLDFMDNAVPFVIGFPAIAVFALWTLDRRRKQKSST